MTSFEDMGFDELNSYAKFDGLTKKEIGHIETFCIIKRKKREHLCNSCAKNRYCYIEAEISVDSEHDYNQYTDIVECAFWEEKRWK